MTVERKLRVRIRCRLPPVNRQTRYYDVQMKRERVVTIRAVGVKERNRVRVGGKEIGL